MQSLFFKHMLVHCILAVISFAVVWFWLGSFFWAVVSLLISVFLDVDHLFDYWLAHGFNLDWRRFVEETTDRGGLYFLKSGKLLILFHSWEILVLVWLGSLVWDLPWFSMAFIFSFVPHLLWDQLTYAKNPLMYFFLFRAWKRFELEEVCGG